MRRCWLEFIRQIILFSKAVEVVWLLFEELEVINLLRFFEIAAVFILEVIVRDPSI